MTDEELKSLDATRDQVNQVKGIMLKVTDKYGTMLAVYQVLVTDKEDGHELHDGPFKVKIKITDEMKKYNEFVLIYFDDEFKNEDPISLKIEGDYLVGTLPHLSPYALVGNTKLPDNPTTGDNIHTWFIVLAISVIGIVGSGLYIRKASKSR
jgi:LPXTG-motif cell wall-anchored protein